MCDRKSIPFKIFKVCISSPLGMKSISDGIHDSLPSFVPPYTELHLNGLLREEIKPNKPQAFLFKPSYFSSVLVDRQK